MIVSTPSLLVDLLSRFVSVRDICIRSSMCEIKADYPAEDGRVMGPTPQMASTEAELSTAPAWSLALVHYNLVLSILHDFTLYSV
jgi:hypothetical protein